MFYHFLTIIGAIFLLFSEFLLNRNPIERIYGLSLTLSLSIMLIMSISSIVIMYAYFFKKKWIYCTSITYLVLLMITEFITMNIPMRIINTTVLMILIYIFYKYRDKINN